MTQGKDGGANKARKPYKKPTLTKLSGDAAKAKLLRLASEGDQGAKDALELLFPETLAKDPKTKKKSA